MDLELERLRQIAAENIRYERQIARLKDAGKQTSCISAAVEKSLANIVGGSVRSFIIYGEPQSGKTEMMICLTAKMIDAGFNVVIHLLNDSVTLLQQNLERFQRSGLAPSARNFSEVMDPSISLSVGQHVIFCKKNAQDLLKLSDKLVNVTSKVIIDDEADYATPNSKINKGEVTRINGLIGKILGSTGIYIGVTATPARLDLNNTFDNNNEVWVDFPPHSAYTGQDDFFPIEGAPDKYTLTLLPDNYDGPKFLQQAILRFLVKVAHINITGSKPENFSMLVHTSGKKIDHKADKKPIEDVFQALADVDSAKFAKVIVRLGTIASEKYESAHVKRILEFIVINRNTYHIVTMNSERDKNVDLKSATDPASLFTFAIGGNIVSRGVTFNNLLSMFFTRDSKHKIQQDTYIQRARMFGSRKNYLEHFELTIPNQLFVDWHRCFVFHKLALAAIRSGLGSPVWLGDTRISPVSASSVDQANVSLDKGEMSFALFSYDQRVWAEIDRINDPFEKLRKLHKTLGASAVPSYLLEYVQHTSRNKRADIAVHEPASIARYTDAEGLDKAKIQRRRGFFGKSQRDKFPSAVHHFAVFYNAEGKARLFYKYDGNISFIKNLKNV